jgi:phosphohistidine phosphatase
MDAGQVEVTRVSSANTRAPQQAAAIAVRRVAGSFEICLITRTESKGWGIPKGLIDPGDTAKETALNEAWEEAGLKGRIVGNAIGTYEYVKWHTTLVVAVYVMEVLEEHGDWLEAGVRQRRWTSFAQAASLLVDHPIRLLLDRAKVVIASGLA